MSLDVYLELDTTVAVPERVPVRIDGATKMLSREEYAVLNPGREPIALSEEETTVAYHANITHNLGKMASEAFLYDCCWRPDENGYRLAKQLIGPLSDGLTLLKADPAHFKQFNPANNWGSYEGLIEFVENYLAACKQYPQARVSVWR